jgi:anti-anti-sigma regulatory factor
MENFSLKIIEHIAVIKVELVSATLRDSQTLWDLMDIESIFEKKKILIDLSDCTFIDSTFIGMIVKIYRHVSKYGSVIKIVFPKVSELESFKLIGITKIIECFPTIRAAVESFTTDSPALKIEINEKNVFNAQIA